MILKYSKLFLLFICSGKNIDLWNNWKKQRRISYKKSLPNMKYLLFIKNIYMIQKKWKLIIPYSTTQFRSNNDAQNEKQSSRHEKETYQKFPAANPPSQKRTRTFRGGQTQNKYRPYPAEIRDSEPSSEHFNSQESRTRHKY